MNQPGDLAAHARWIARAIADAESLPADSQPRVIMFRIGTARVALPLTSVREIVVPPPGLSRVPRAPQALVGVMNLRGRVVAVVDLLHALSGPIAAKLPATPPGPAGHDLATGRLIILERGRREVALIASVVDGIEAADAVGSDVTVLDPDEVGDAIDALVE
jgi:purine-binding chemotaxis protein CheW